MCNPLQPIGKPIGYYSYNPATRTSSFVPTEAEATPVVLDYEYTAEDLKLRSILDNLETLRDKLVHETTIYLRSTTLEQATNRSRKIKGLQARIAKLEAEAEALSI